MNVRLFLTFGTDSCQFSSKGQIVWSPHLISSYLISDRPGNDQKQPNAHRGASLFGLFRLSGWNAAWPGNHAYPGWTLGPLTSGFDSSNHSEPDPAEYLMDRGICQLPSPLQRQHCFAVLIDVQSCFKHERTSPKEIQWLKTDLTHTYISLSLWFLGVVFGLFF